MQYQESDMTLVVWSYSFTIPLELRLSRLRETLNRKYALYAMSSVRSLVEMGFRSFSKSNQEQRYRINSYTICRALSLFITMILFVTTFIVFQSLKPEQAACFFSQFSSLGTNRWQSLHVAGGVDDPTFGYVLPQKLTLNDRAWLLNQLLGNGSSACDHVPTMRAHVFGLPTPRSQQDVILPTNQDVDLLVVSYSANGSRRCSGGDFYETDLSGARWKSRPPIRDLGDGSYLVTMRVDSRFAGLYTFKAYLLYSNFHGLDFEPERWMRGEELVSLQIHFFDTTNSSGLSRGSVKLDPRVCTVEDFKLKAWRGRWIRSKWNESCTSADDDGRFRCLDANEQCESPWCEGPVGSIESNGWVYSAHCAFRIFTLENAWSCLEGRWIYSWGDSNHQDTFRNLLNFILGFKNLGNLERTFDTVYKNPLNQSQELRITQQFNGHFDDQQNWLGLASLDNPEYKDRVSKPWFSPANSPNIPDTMIMSTGLHDGMHFRNLKDYIEGSERAASFWESVWRNVTQDVTKRPRLLYRTTVAPAGDSRHMRSNPQKMEAFNTAFVDSLVTAFGENAAHIQFMDAFDLTFPWHYDHNCSDGGHYGKPPALHSWKGITTGHQYFVDMMMGNIFLNVLCPLR